MMGRGALQNSVGERLRGDRMYLSVFVGLIMCPVPGLNRDLTYTLLGPSKILTP